MYLLNYIIYKSHVYFYSSKLKPPPFKSKQTCDFITLFIQKATLSILMLYVHKADSDIILIISCIPSYYGFQFVYFNKNV